MFKFGAEMSGEESSIRRVVDYLRGLDIIL